MVGGHRLHLKHDEPKERLATDWQPHTREQNQAILNALGLTSEFWRLP